MDPYSSFKWFRLESSECGLIVLFEFGMLELSHKVTINTTSKTRGNAAVDFRFKRKKAQERPLTKAHILPESAFALATQHERNCHKQHEIYIANPNPTLAYPTQTLLH